MNASDNQIKTHASLVERRCSICGSQEAVCVYDQPTENIAGIGDIGYHHLINVCNECGFVFAAPILAEDEILKYYEKMSNYEHPESTGIRPIEDVRQINRQIEFILSRLTPGFKGRALDIGCSIAYGLSLLKNQGWEVLGLDPSDKCIEISREKLGVTVERGFFSLELLANQKPFDVIILSHVVEHLVHPDVIIRQLFGLLKDDGIVYIEVPNLMKPNGTKCYFGFEHVNFFTPQSMINLVCQNGFSVDCLKTFDNGKEIHPFYPVIALTIRKSESKQPFCSDRSEVLKVIEEYKSGADLLAKKINARIQDVLDKTLPGKLALWGGGIHTSQLLSETILKSASIECIYDNDPKKAGAKLMGIEIRNFPVDPSLAKNNIDAILISSEASELAIYNQISHLQSYGISVYRLYGDLPSF